MHPQVQLNIPQPCHEDWHKMTTSEKGRFCNACAKEVVDFTNMSDTEVLHYFLDNKNEKVCGRMYPDQLNRPVTKPIYPEKKKWWYWNYAAMLLLFFQKTTSAKIHGGLDIKHTTFKKEPVFSTKEFYKFSQANVLHVKTAVTGTVVDENGTPLPGASITIKGTTVAAVSDSKGEFHIEANNQTDIINVSYVGYETASLSLKNLKLYSEVTITLKPQALGEVVIVGGLLSTEGSDNSPAPKHVAIIEVLDNATHEPVKAILVFNKANNDTATTDTKGIYKLKRIKEDEKFSATVNADGYLPSELEIKGWAFSERKETKYVFLEKAPVLSDYKQMEAVTVNNYGTTVGKIVVGSISRGDECTINSGIKQTFTDTISIIKTKLTGSLKIAPNPVQRGNALTLSYSVKQTGNHLLQITNSSGQVVLQQQITAVQKNNTATIMTNSGWSGGVYYLRLIDAKNNLLSTNSFIVQ